MNNPTDVALLRHTLSTLAYRAGKVLRGTNVEFATFTAGPGVRTPAQLVAHLGDLLDWATSTVRGQESWRPVAPQAWQVDVDRFFATLATLDAAISPGLAEPMAQKLFQGPIADALTHVGQLALLRRLAAQPIRGENYARATIRTGQVGPEQAAPAYEFD